MALPNKKQKTSDQTVLQPISFEISGMAADVSLKVFDQEFLVHSPILKIHSAFFNKFLDSPDKTVVRGIHVEGEIKYQWVTELDGENDWQLVANLSEENLDTTAYKGNKKHQQHCFLMILCAVYSKPYVLRSIRDLQILVELADYYRTLPSVSRTLTDALFNSGKFNSDIQKNCCLVLQMATEARNKVLFKEALCYAIGPWYHPKYLTLYMDKNLRKVCENVYNKVAATCMNMHYRIMKLDHGETERLNDKISEWRQYQDGVSLPVYFRKVHSMGLIDASKLLTNNLVLQGRDYLAGEGDYQDWFLCAEISDEDLPWDITQTEW
ncbi:hypothetical protein EG329_002603 [Mollisiaceae sp. DMI_Dod_QoI]|nr:hypothetical protein EG329_002603 [Helotiales sp. DMI_Dod_QoI]